MFEPCTFTSVATRHLFYICFNIFLHRPEKFHGLLQRLWFSEANKLASSSMKPASQFFERFSASIRNVCDFEYQLNKGQLVRMLTDIRQPHKRLSYCNSESVQSACWAPFDIYLEHIMDGKQLLITSGVSMLTGNALEVICAYFNLYLCFWVGICIDFIKCMVFLFLFSPLKNHILST